MRAFVLCWLGVALLLAGTLSQAAPPRNKSQPPARDKAPATRAGEDASDLSLEVEALGTLHKLQVRRGQLEALAKLAAPAARAPHPQGKASARLLRALADLRTALIAGEETKVGELETLVDELQDREAPDLDTSFELTAGSRTNARAAFDLLSARQVALYIAARDDITEPVELLVLVAEKGAGRPRAEWEALCDEAVEEVATLLAGVRPKDHRDAVESLVAWLEAQHKKGGKVARKEIETVVTRLIRAQSALDLLRNAVERDLAELLANPRAKDAIRARLAAE